jgi:YesN/AraC family two-component response regulator
MITVIIADDCILFREGLRFLIEQDKNIKVVGFADDGQHEFELCNSLNPDIVLMDIKMPNYDGIEGLKLINETECFSCKQESSWYK